MMLLKLAFRNILRNGRRSAMTASTIAVGAIALILLGEYRGMAVIGLQTIYVQDVGHLSVFRKGFFEFGSARPETYSISGYDRLIALIKGDAELKPMLNVVTPAVSLGGIAGSAVTDRSTTFFGTGFVPSDRDKMRRWDEYRLYTTVDYAAFPLRDDDIDHGVIGKGLARILGLCGPLKIAECPRSRERTGDDGSGLPGPPRIDLLSSASGAPNVVAFYVSKAQSQGAKVMDDGYIGMHIKLAQQLLYGRDSHKAGSIVIQLKRSEDMGPARSRLNALFVEHHLDLEVRDFTELQAFYKQVIGYLQVLFGFLSTILGTIVLFTIANTMGMSVMERTNEIGTARAMGVQRASVRRQFLLEGAMLGAVGCTAGVLLAIMLTYAINHAGITYHMPISASAVPLYLMDENVAGLRFGVWLALVFLASVASIVPANRAAAMKVVDALRHV